jgi:alpha-beta hydrolase superfamily lysophospholipase
MPDSAFRIISGADGTSLQAYAWRSAAPPRAVVVIAHGAAEHALRYERFGRALGAAGFASYALDHRGHGKSPGPKGLGDFGAAGWPGLVADLGQLLDHARSANARLPLALFGHSMGSFAAAELTFDRSGSLDALVLSGSTALGPGVALDMNFNAPFEPARTPYDWLSRDPAEVDQYVADPLCGFESQGDRAPTPETFQRALFDADAPRSVRSDLPVLLVAGDADPINVKLAGLRLLETRWREAGVKRVDTRYYPGGRHEMLNETNRDEVTSDIVTWLRTALGVA